MKRFDIETEWSSGSGWDKHLFRWCYDMQVIPEHHNTLYSPAQYFIEYYSKARMAWVPFSRYLKRLSLDFRYEFYEWLDDATIMDFERSNDDRR